VLAKATNLRPSELGGSGTASGIRPSEDWLVEYLTERESGIATTARCERFALHVVKLFWGRPSRAHENRYP